MTRAKSRAVEFVRSAKRQLPACSIEQAKISVPISKSGMCYAMVIKSL